MRTLKIRLVALTKIRLVNFAGAGLQIYGQSDTGPLGNSHQSRKVGPTLKSDIGDGGFIPKMASYDDIPQCTAKQRHTHTHLCHNPGIRAE